MAGSAAWKALQAHFDAVGSKLNMRALFAADPARFEKLRSAQRAEDDHCIEKLSTTIKIINLFTLSNLAHSLNTLKKIQRLTHIIPASTQSVSGDRGGAHSPGLLQERGDARHAGSAV